MITASNARDMREPDISDGDCPIALTCYRHTGACAASWEECDRYADATGCAYGTRTGHGGGDVR